ncbi:EF-P lysine aminoacylase GenX [Treponema primitia]|uniref:EF-P lysine aminoacylase GenX n=1 Tax=Treponema primitia TaxID=88058 RepID=UPI000255579B|nr:amino acid--tRNA ligase-related protein [Treponema primitia]
MDIELLQERARIFREVRAFFDKRGYLELDTPLLAPDLIPETCLEVFETAYLAPPNSKTRETQPYWLIPSPEIWMKKIIARHRTSVYQICKCFRNGESTGHLHSPEFTMLEYYTMGADYLDSLTLTEELFASLLGDSAKTGYAGQTCLRPPFLRITMEEAFSRWAGFSLYDAAEKGTLATEARKLGLTPPTELDTPALYDLIFIHAVEPALPKDKAVVITDYPAFVPCLAQKSPDHRTVERWELYVRGIELANCYSEETDPEQVRRYFEREGALKNRDSLVPHRIDGDYWQHFLPTSGEASGFPQCSGVALGLDRLVMALTGRSSIDSVLPFPMHHIPGFTRA